MVPSGERSRRTVRTAPTSKARLNWRSGLGSGQGELDGAPGLTEFLHQAKRFETERLVFDEDKDLDAGMKTRHPTAGFEEFGEDGVAPAEAESWQVRPASTDKFHQSVIATATRDGAELPLAIEGFEHHAGVVVEAADHAVVDPDKVGEAARCELIENGLELGIRSPGGDKTLNGLPRGADGDETFLGDLGFLTLELVDGLVERRGTIGLAPPHSKKDCQAVRLLRRTTKSAASRPRARRESMRSAINSASAPGSVSPKMSALNWKCSRWRPFCCFS